ncbi:MAG TPA: T9SS type A sorting domain-containing protein [Ignavibacteriaceae bacterium]|nr:T9SS type A sorting domain-containing protein [Ignavibacteriaceae bacterium]
MKTYFSFLFIITFVVDLLSQGYYPIQEGNLWQYRESDPMSGNIWQAEIGADTILSNNITYSFYSGGGFSTNFLRQEGSKVFAYDKKDSAEYVLLDFSANVKDTISVRNNGYRTIVLQSIIQNQPNKQWIFSEYWGDSLYSYIFATWTITDSIGLTGLTGEPGITYYLSGAIINGTVIGTIADVKEGINLLPNKATLMQNYPNPFNPITTIKFVLPISEKVELKIYNLIGQEIITLTSMYYSAGEHQIQWDASNQSSGIYFYKLKTSNYTETKKLLLLK